MAVEDVSKRISHIIKANPLRVILFIDLIKRKLKPVEYPRLYLHNLLYQQKSEPDRL